MTVSQISENQIKVILTNTEVLGCFGAYERLYTMSDSIKSALNALVREIIADYGFIHKNCKVLARIKARKHIGCEITLSAVKRRSQQYETPLTFEFGGCEELTQGILRLYSIRENRRLKSSLYRLNDNFRLIIIANKTLEHFFMMNEFCRRISDCEAVAEYTKEYGKLIIENNAIEKYGSAFS